MASTAPTDSKAPIIVCTQSSQVLGSRLAQELSLLLTPVTRYFFPDGEMYLRIEFPSPKPKNIILIGSTPTHTDIIELFLLIDACEDASITLVIPYMGYARQDKKFSPGEPISARAIARTLGANVAQVITVNIHEAETLFEFVVPATNISLSEEIANHILTSFVPPGVKPLILAPDKGALELAKDIAAACDADYDYLSKRRISGEEVVIEAKSVPVLGRELVIVDDIISTGGTLGAASKMLIAQGAVCVHAICVHGVFIQGAYTRLKHYGLGHVCSSDTIESASSNYSAAPAIAKKLRELLPEISFL
jgi:ribose-phosphate pyrophosphokinase